MNERIKQLDDIAHFYADEHWLPGPEWHKFYIEKFTELIVEECMKLNSKELSITAIERLLPLYEEHFGVEL